MRRREAGQASVELVAALPIVAAVVLALLQLLAAGAAREGAGHAAQAGATALLRGEDPRDAARSSLPGWGRRGMTVVVRGRSVRVRVRPRTLLPGLAGPLTATSTAHAGPR